MGFCSKDEHEGVHALCAEVRGDAGQPRVSLLKHYLDIGKDEQTRRLAQRKRDPLKQWKSSPIDAVAVKHWKAYPMRATPCCCERTPQLLVARRARDDKRLARLNLDARHPFAAALRRQEEQARPARPGVAFEFTPDCIAAKQRLAR